MFKKFIEQPVLSTVISIFIVLLGILGIYSLAIEQYPDIAPPTVQVSATYSGANAETVLKSVIVPLEEQINGVEGMTYMTSTATNEGTATIKVYFKVGTDPDQAAVNVQNRVSWASSVLPSDVTKAGVTTKKQQNSNLLIFSLSSSDAKYDETFLQNYAEINLIPQIKRINGVGDASAFGSKSYSMRIWLKPDVMSQYNVTASDITAALSDQNVEAAPGKFGENSNQSFQYIIRYKGTFSSTDEYGNIVIKADTTGNVIRLKDVAKIELGSQTYNSITNVNGKPAIGIAISQVAGSNAQEIIQSSKTMLDAAGKKLPKGLHMTYMVDVNQFLDASIEKVIHTLIEAFILVFIVVFIFLQDWRSTLIPAIAVPVAIVGTFFFLELFGFSINLLTLFALVLAIGIVVDDAIVVVEAVHAKLDEGYKSSRKASIDAMSEISGAIISITLVMAAVFIPVSFISGSSGVFYKQFGITLAIAIVLSAINALTLSPALAAIFLRPHKEGDNGKKKSLPKRMADSFNAGFSAVTEKYGRAVKFLSVKKWVTFLLLAIFAGGLVGLIKTSSSSFVPDEDMGTVFVNITMPAATSMEKTNEVATRINNIVQAIPGVKNTLKIVGQNFLSGSGSSYAMVIMSLNDWKERDTMSQQQVINQVFARTGAVKEASVIAFGQPTINGFGMTTGISMEMQDKESHSTDQFYKVVQEFLAKMQKLPQIQYATTSFNPNFPQYVMDVNVPKIKQAGLTVSSIMTAMQVFYGGYYVNNFNEFGKQYRVIAQAMPKYRANPDQLKNIYVKTSTGAEAPITEFISLKRDYGPETRTRFNLYNSMTVTAGVNSGYSNGEAIAAVQNLAAQNLPSGYSYEFSGMTREEQSSGSTSFYIFIICLVFVYLLLSAQYESYLLPFAVLLSLPVGLCGTFLFDRIFGIDNNIYAQISLIMLIGLLAKNAILIVEYALERRVKEKQGLVESAVNGAKARLRPILMTSFAFIFGLLPLMLSSGVGANGNKSIGTSAVGGMLFGTLFGVFIIPALYVVFQGLQEWISSKTKQEEDDTENTAVNA